MLKIGLTGSIGSGKSTIAKVFSLLGVPVYLSDIEAKRFLDDHAVVQLIAEKFGVQIINAEGKIDRVQLASIVFNDKTHLKWLNSIIHPMVRRHFFDWVESMKHHPYIIQESAIMLETGFSSYFHKVIVVTCPLEERINRVLSRDKMTRQQIMERMQNQWTEELKVEKADILIDNSDYSLAVPQIISVHEKIIEEAHNFATI